MLDKTTSSFVLHSFVNASPFPFPFSSLSTMAPSRISLGHPTSSEPGLSKQQLETFEQDGYLLIPDALDANTVSSLLSETHSMLENFSLDDHPMTKFSTGEGKNGEHVGDDYFLSSGDKIRFFFEEGTNSHQATCISNLTIRISDAFDTSGNLTKPKSRAINKIGHYLHALSLPFASLLSPSFTHSPGAIARSLGFREPQCLQSMIICKQPEIGGAVPPHQDSTFLFTDPPSAVGFWYALEDATVENGCLSFLPGSHKTAEIKERFVRKKDGSGTEFIDNDWARFPPGNGYTAEETEGEYKLGEVKAGTLVLIHGNLLHKSEKNVSQKGRIIYTFHVIEGEGAVYDERNWLQPPKEGFTKI